MSPFGPRNVLPCTVRALIFTEQNFFLHCKFRILVLFYIAYIYNTPTLKGRIVRGQHQEA